MPNRSWLYVPGDARDKLDSARGRGADAVIVDLEDAVAPGAKETARSTAIDWLGTIDEAGSGPATEVWVRVNGDRAWRDDDVAALAALPRPSVLSGVLVPKATPERITAVIDAMTGSDGELRVGVAGLVEDARSLVDVDALASTPGLSHLGVGEADLRAELRLDPSEDEAELRPLRFAVVAASAAAGLRPPVGPASTDFDDLDRLRRSTDGLRRLGFVGRTAIHPRQVPVINDVFTPTNEQVDAARRVVEGLEAAVASDRGVMTGADGRMVDEAVARRARQTLDLAAAARQRAAPD